MRILVNDQEVEIARGMTVKHALSQAGILAEIKASKKVFDEWDNELGLDGALSEGMKLYVKEG
ncbi:MAG: hypothetical protein EHM27_07015 [Deltaproteobacteria bacterium]|jgi:hypothetical protein|nr:MAG: hypothetical protein EHM27_07015 [Deltaproteobacteria bacterium]